jgi:hypothetical protein
MRTGRTITVSPNPGHDRGDAAIGKLLRARCLLRALPRRCSLSSCAPTTERSATRTARSQTFAPSDSSRRPDEDSGRQSCRPASYPLAATTRVASKELRSGHRCPGSTAASGYRLHPLGTLGLSPHPSTCTDRAIAHSTRRSCRAHPSDAHFRVAARATHHIGAPIREAVAQRAVRAPPPTPQHRVALGRVGRRSSGHRSEWHPVCMLRARYKCAAKDSLPGVITWS